ncbi:hypothetical protein [Sulfurimonas sp. HSL-1716]|uniref:hypothetical protein n=1 Tax=Hydrocurvibacter sulfurireducens TaxID=3131937 RepID=UPI0031F93AD1
MMNPDEIKIRDIKPLLEIQDHSIYLFAALIVIALIILFGSAYLIFRWYKNKNRINIRKSAYKKLLQVELFEAKKAAYEITKYGYLFKDDSQRNRDMYHNLVERLEKYKYRKDVQDFDEEAKSYFELYKGMIDV